MGIIAKDGVSFVSELTEKAKSVQNFPTILHRTITSNQYTAESLNLILSLPFA
jgi:hypothetical protein